MEAAAPTAVRRTTARRRKILLGFAGRAVPGTAPNWPERDPAPGLLPRPQAPSARPESFAAHEANPDEPIRRRRRATENRHDRPKATKNRPTVVVSPQSFKCDAAPRRQAPGA